MKRMIALSLTSLLLSSPAAVALTKADVHATLSNGVKAIESMGVDAAVPYTQDPSNGMIDLDGSGLHLWAINGSGAIVFDNSGQTQPGMDVSTIPLFEDGTLALEAVTQVSANSSEGVSLPFPHPTSMEMGTAYMACSAVSDIFVCAMGWGL